MKEKRAAMRERIESAHATKHQNTGHAVDLDQEEVREDPAEGDDDFFLAAQGGVAHSVRSCGCVNGSVCGR